MAPPLQPTKLFLLDDHLLFREGLLRLLESDDRFEVVGHTGKTTEALSLLTQQPVDVLILDYDLGNETAVTFTNELRQSGFAGRILIVTAGLPDRDAAQLIGMGVSGILHKQDSPDELHRSIEAVANGHVLIDQKYLQTILRAAQPAESGVVQFTERERLVLRSLLQGLSNKEIADKAQTSESAIKSSLQQLFNKLGVRTRSQLVLLTLEKYRTLL